MVGRCLCVPDRLARWRHQTDSALFLFAAASIPLVLLEVQRSELSPADQRFVDVVNIAIFVVFLIDYTVELVKSEDPRAYIRGEWLLGLVVWHMPYHQSRQVSAETRRCAR